MRVQTKAALTAIKAYSAVYHGHLTVVQGGIRTHEIRVPNALIIPRARYYSAHLRSENNPLARQLNNFQLLASSTPDPASQL